MNDWRAIEQRLVDAARVCGHSVYKGTEHTPGEWFIDASPAIADGTLAPEGVFWPADINLTEIAREMAAL